MRYDISEIGAINCQVDFDEDFYQDYLEENNLQNNTNTLLNYIQDNCNFDVTYLDSEYFHDMGYESLSYEEILEEFGEKMANDILNDSIDGKEHSYEILEYQDDNIDINNPQELNAAAVKFLRSGDYYKNCRGFILTNGTVVYTPKEHNESSKIPGVKGTFDFIRLGNVRVLDHSIDMEKEPTREQLAVIREVCDSYEGETLYLDLMNKEIGHASKKYDYCDSQEVISDILNYFRNGVKPRQINENKKSIRISENKLNKMISESIKHILNQHFRS